MSSRLVLVLVNSGSPAYQDGMQIVLPYLDHFGVPYRIIDLMYTPLPVDVAEQALVVVAHRQRDMDGRRLGDGGKRALIDAFQHGCGYVSFDPLLFDSADAAKSGHLSRTPHAPVSGDVIKFGDCTHYITALHETGETLALGQSLSMLPSAPFHGSADATDSATLLTVGDAPVLSVQQLGQGRLVTWATSDWGRTTVLGPVAGLDDVLWRSLVWAARKPFALRGMPPFLTMRVDDVAGTGGLWHESPLYWVRTCNRYGLKPWLGLFLYNLTPDAIAETKTLVADGQATAFPHAFGRPPRHGARDYFYSDQALPLRSTTYDEFIYFDHERGRPWPDDEAARGLAAVDAWHARTGIPISPYAVAHWYEAGLNVMRHLQQRWGVEFICKIQDADASLSKDNPWLALGPFRRHELPGACHSDTTRRSGRPVYYADFVNFGGVQLFNCVTEIRDDAGYEWAPDNDIPATVCRGVRQLRRALDSMVLPVLFTHETDYIYKISPDAWEAEIAQIMGAIHDDGYEPVCVTLDEGARYARALRTSRMTSCSWDAARRVVSASYTGHADVTTQFLIFTDSDAGITSRRADVPAFSEHALVEVQLQSVHVD